jgi:hypothetical protein
MGDVSEKDSSACYGEKAPGVYRSQFTSNYQNPALLIREKVKEVFMK